MAKGNDGNYLQHCVEVESAMRLVQMCAEGRLHIALIQCTESVRQKWKAGNRRFVRVQRGCAGG